MMMRFSPLFVCYFVGAILFFHHSNALSAAAVVTDLPTVSLSSSGIGQLSILDGAEWSSIQNILRQEKRLEKGRSTKFGYMNIVTGTTENSERVVAMQAPNSESSGSISVYEDSIAVIPGKMSNEDAISTYIASLSTIEPVLPLVEQVGGSDETIVGGKSVVLGSNDLACFAAQGLASLGVDVSLVSNGNPKVKAPSSAGKLDILKPAVGPSKIGFAQHIGKFDSMLDTLNDEGIPTSFFEGGDDDDDPFFSFRGTVLELLKTRHECERYVSTRTHCQSIMEKEGVFGGPGRADEYLKRLSNPSFVVGNPECQSIPPPQDFGSTMTKIFNAGIVFSDNQRMKLCKKSNGIVKGWTLADFWEQTTWPRDSSGNGGTRFGLPVIEDEDDEDKPLLQESPRLFPERTFENNEPIMEPPPKPVQDNPFVVNVAGVYGMTTEIVDKELDSIMFLSAKFCKTCKSINPLYTRMARLSQERSSPVVFTKAEASGAYGKELGRRLEIDAVPAFVLFRKGQRYGTPLSVSRLPSKKIEKALELLESGEDWDSSVLAEDF